MVQSTTVCKYRIPQNYHNKNVPLSTKNNYVFLLGLRTCVFKTNDGGVIVHLPTKQKFTISIAIYETGDNTLARSHSELTLPICLTYNKITTGRSHMCASVLFVVKSTGVPDFIRSEKDLSASCLFK